MVQTCKKELWKICLTRNKKDWHLALLYITMGYKMSKHAFLFHFSPYFLLFGRHPNPPSSIAIQMDQVVDLDSPATCTTRNSIICNHHVCNWDATAGCMQLSLVFFSTTMDFCPLFGCVCNYGATMITFIPTFGCFFVIYHRIYLICMYS
jgi:hypothetical protein